MPLRNFRNRAAKRICMETSKGFAPIARMDAGLLILGSLPGRMSLQEQQYYAHPRNAFWTIMEAIYGICGSYRDRCQGLMDNQIALWDVLGESQRPGSLDADIRLASATANDFPEFVQAHGSLHLIAFNGKKAQQLFRRMVRMPAGVGVDYVGLPSTSPALASLSIPAKIAAWRDGLTIGS